MASSSGSSTLLTLVTALLAGGFAGQVATLTFGNRFAEKLAFDNWLRNERFKIFSELLTLVSSTAERDYEQWPGQIRGRCQQVYLLYPTGEPPQRLQDAMEEVFQRAWEMKQGEVSNYDEWVERLRRDADVWCEPHFPDQRPSQLPALRACRASNSTGGRYPRLECNRFLL
jgi:hypothetical protein